jgi:FAD/FMN-containing dehydrogenase
MSFRQTHVPWVLPGEIDCHVADLTATISADMTLKEVQRRLGEFDQWLPMDGDENLGIGLLVEENSSGPLRLGYGAWRDLLLGCQFRTKSGKLITAGGRTVKNVAGYDLTKFMVGQRGVFGKIVTVTTRTYKRPGGALAARFVASDQLVSGMMATAIRPRWAALTGDSLWLGWLENGVGLDFFEEEVGKYSPLEIFRQSLEGDIAQRMGFWKMEGDWFRASVPPTRILEFASRGKLERWSADAAFGIVVGSMGNLEETLLIVAAESVGGSVTISRRGQEPQWKVSEGESVILGRLMKVFES